ncbi:MAG TPA: HEXXH motif-containing putative peptide modification protein [Ilumatobacteraceae bacterium]|nr:HEXXH motif-containing putative peptide modification protein [Ilumatobacteraceae bacterium]
MHSALADSLKYLTTAVPELARRAGLTPAEVDKQLIRLAEQRFAPHVFARYYELVPQVEAGQLDAAADHFGVIVRAEPLAGDRPRICGIEDPPLREVADLYRSKLDTDPQTDFRLLQPDDAELDRAQRLLESASRRFEPVLSDGFAELRATVSEVIVAVGEPGSPYQFGGASSYMLWGALLLNAQRMEDERAVTISLMHEAAHTLLFGQTIDEPLVLNGDDEFYDSPLRSDPRPMDGIFHATFVSARMHQALAMMLQSDALSDDEREPTVSDQQLSERAFLDGLEVVREHGRLTPTGREVMAAAEAYMNN